MHFPYRKALEGLTPYPPGKPIEEVQREYGLTEVVKLASNENPHGPSPKALEAIAREAKDLHQYPESGCHYLRVELAKRLGVPADYLMFGNGSDEIVAMLTMAFLDDTTNIVCSETTFIRYEMGATSMGARTKHVPLKDWHHDVDALAAAVDAQTRFVFVGNPDNPVGSVMGSAALDRLLAAVPKTALIVLDEAYYEFACSWPDYPRAVDLVKSHPNLIVLRTFSKAYGLAGIRLGYGIGHPDIWNAVDRIRPPFNANRLAQAAALAALDDNEHLRKTTEGNKSGLEYLYGHFKDLNLPYVPSYANFVLVDMKRPAAPLYDALLKRGVVVRPMTMYGLPSHLRISVGLPRENQIFIEALREVLKTS